MKWNLLIGLLKLFLFRKVAVHIFKNSAFRNPFIPAVKETAEQWQQGSLLILPDLLRPNTQIQTKHSLGSKWSYSLFVPSAVMNKVFNLLIFNADLYAL